MFVFFLAFSVVILFTLFLGACIGGIVKAKSIKDYIPTKNGKVTIDKDLAIRIINNIEQDCIRTREDNKTFIIYIILLLLWVGMIFAFSFEDIREYYINQYKSNEVVEKVKYDYKIINGKKELVDSTFYFERNK